MIQAMFAFKHLIRWRRAQYLRLFTDEKQSGSMHDFLHHVVSDQLPFPDAIFNGIPEMNAAI